MPGVLLALAAGFGLGILLAAPPGPVMAVMATESARGETRRSMMMAFGAMSGDAVWLAVAAAGFLAYLSQHPRAVGSLGILGAALLLWMAWGTLQGARRGIGEARARGSYALGFTTILTSPYSPAYWLSAGPILLAEWGVAGVVGLFAGLLTYTTAFTFGMAWIGARVKVAALVVAWASVFALSGLALWVGARSIGLLTGAYVEP
ncbi:MAG: LysE family transporter [Methanobacteriota archaeon]